MKNILIIGVLALASSVPVLGQVDCNSAVVDQAHILSTTEVSKLTNELQTLSALGADPRVITVDTNLPEEFVIRNFTHSCLSWQNPSQTGVKNNMVVFMVSPSIRKMGIFVGPAYNSTTLTPATLNDIKRNDMGPYFHAQKWGEGLVSGVKGVNAVINVQHSTAKSIAHILYLIAGIIFLGFLLFVILYFVAQDKKKKTAQQLAISAKNGAATALKNVKDILTNKKMSVANQNKFDTFFERFSEMGSELSNDPYDKTLTLADYKRIETMYDSFSNDLGGFYNDVTRGKSAKKSKKNPVNNVVPEELSPVAPSQSAPVSSQDYPTQSTSQTVYVDNGSDNFVSGLVAGELLEEESHGSSSRDDDWDSGSSGWDSSSSDSSGSSDSWGGDSSDFGSSDSGSDWEGDSSSF